MGNWGERHGEPQEGTRKLLRPNLPKKWPTHLHQTASASQTDYVAAQRGCFRGIRSGPEKYAGAGWSSPPSGVPPSLGTAWGHFPRPELVYRISYGPTCWNRQKNGKGTVSWSPEKIAEELRKKMYSSPRLNAKQQNKTAAVFLVNTFSSSLSFTRGWAVELW